MAAHAFRLGSARRKPEKKQSRKSPHPTHLPVNRVGQLTLAWRGSDVKSGEITLRLKGARELSLGDFITLTERSHILLILGEGI